MRDVFKRLRPSPIVGRRVFGPRARDENAKMDEIERLGRWGSGYTGDEGQGEVPEYEPQQHWAMLTAFAAQTSPLHGLYSWILLRQNSFSGPITSTTSNVITAPNHGLVSGMTVFIDSVVSNNIIVLGDPNGIFTITVIDANTFSLNGSTTAVVGTGGRWQLVNPPNWTPDNSISGSATDMPAVEQNNLTNVQVSSSAGVVANLIGSSGGGLNGLVLITAIVNHELQSGDYVAVWDVEGAYEANGLWQVDVVDPLNFTLRNSSLANTWTSATGEWATFDGAVVKIWPGEGQAINADSYWLFDGSGKESGTLPPPYPPVPVPTGSPSIPPEPGPPQAIGTPAEIRILTPTVNSLGYFSAFLEVGIPGLAGGVDYIVKMLIYGFERNGILNLDAGVRYEAIYIGPSPVDETPVYTFSWNCCIVPTQSGSGAAVGQLCVEIISSTSACFAAGDVFVLTKNADGSWGGPSGSGCVYPGCFAPTIVPPYVDKGLNPFWVIGPYPFGANCAGGAALYILQSKNIDTPPNDGQGYSFTPFFGPFGDFADAVLWSGQQQGNIPSNSIPCCPPLPAGLNQGITNYDNNFATKPQCIANTGTAACWTLLTGNTNLFVNGSCPGGCPTCPGLCPPWDIVVTKNYEIAIIPPGLYVPLLPGPACVPAPDGGEVCFEVVDCTPVEGGCQPDDTAICFDHALTGPSQMSLIIVSQDQSVVCCTTMTYYDCTKPQSSGFPSPVWANDAACALPGCASVTYSVYSWEGQWWLSVNCGGTVTTAAAFSTSCEIFTQAFLITIAGKQYTMQFNTGGCTSGCNCSPDVGSVTLNLTGTNGGLPCNHCSDFSGTWTLAQSGGACSFSGPGPHGTTIQAQWAGGTWTVTLQGFSGGGVNCNNPGTMTASAASPCSNTPVTLGPNGGGLCTGQISGTLTPNT